VASVEEFNRGGPLEYRLQAESFFEQNRVQLFAFR
jgi:hypothetical protein